ncbi:RibD family protein [Chloroflexota bacterium]
MTRTMGPIETFQQDFEKRQAGLDRPYVTLSYAQSLDGSIANQEGRATQISGPEAFQMTHQLRAVHDAVLVGIGTVLVDDPRLTVRKVEGSSPQAVVLDSRLRCPPQAALMGNPKKPWIITAQPADAARKKALEDLGARVSSLPPDAGGLLSLEGVLSRLGESGVRRVMVEGGGRVIASFLSQRLVDLVILTVAPVFLGGVKAIDAPLLGGKDAAHELIEFPHLEEVNSTWLGGDLVLWGKLA